MADEQAYDAYIQAIVDRAPALTDEQRARLGVLLSPSCITSQPKPSGALAPARADRRKRAA